MDVLDAMILNGFSLSRSVELTAQWDRILAIGPLYPVTLYDLSVVRGVGVGEFHRIVSDVHRRLSDFIHASVVHRRVEAVRGGGIGFGKTPWCIPIGGFVQIWFTLLPFFNVSPISLLGLMRNSERLGFPIFVALGKGRPALGMR